MYYDSSGKCQSRRLPDSSHKGGMIHETARFPQTFGCRSPDRGCRGLRRCPRGQRFFHTGGSSGVQPGRTCQLRRPRRGSQPDHQRGGRHPAGGAGAPDPGRRGPRRLFYPGDQRGGAGAGLRGPGLDAVGPGGGQAVHRGAPRLQLPAARTGGRPSPPAGRHHRGVQHRLRRRAQLHPGALPGGAGARLYRHRRRPDPGRERLDGPAGGGRRAPAEKLRGRSLCRLRRLRGPLPLQGPRDGGLRRRHQKHLHRLGQPGRQKLDPLRRHRRQYVERRTGRLSGGHRGRGQVGVRRAGPRGADRLSQRDEPPFGGLRLRRQPRRAGNGRHRHPGLHRPTRWPWTRPASTWSMPPPATKP